MSASDDPRPSSRARWRAPAIGAVTGLAVAAAIVVPSAVAAGGQSSGPCVAGKAARAAVTSDDKPAPPPAGTVPHQFLDGIAQLQQAGTITAGQARILDADIESGSIDPHKLVADGVVSAAQMKAVNDKLIPIKMGLADQAHASTGAAKPGAASDGG